jgi:hypothetical protein
MGVGVAGNSDDVYVNGPVLWGCVDIGGGMDGLFWGSLSPFVDGLGSSVFGTFPFVDAIELLSPYDGLEKPF